MFRYFVLGGPFMWILLLLGLTVVVLALRDAVALSTRKGMQRLRAASGSGAILFWGCLAAVLGVLGSLVGIYKGLSEIRQAGLVSPNLVAEGIAVSSISTIFGLLILAGAAVVWFSLRWWFRKVTDRQGGQVVVGA